eukprot:gnl/MRDRNA2_/MRDRNA2_65987_c0_seq3.p1 gnl/MRDRNA2_/MRDRNA2_65987_c0~~gnl/MRDRNA2_/MRDRNA2_65987_c0_seq3.p1  ORF type:complete len:358 (-),score=117.04 gnl/MRDRNA2_/MRDRNA2_65987_c0_seq3:178-1251(-)
MKFCLSSLLSVAHANLDSNIQSSAAPSIELWRNLSVAIQDSAFDRRLEDDMVLEVEYELVSLSWDEATAIHATLADPESSAKFSDAMALDLVEREAAFGRMIELNEVVPQVATYVGQTPAPIAGVTKAAEAPGPGGSQEESEDGTATIVGIVLGVIGGVMTLVALFQLFRKFHLTGMRQGGPGAIQEQSNDGQNEQVGDSSGADVDQPKPEEAEAPAASTDQEREPQKEQIKTEDVVVDIDERKQAVTESAVEGGPRPEAEGLEVPDAGPLSSSSAQDATHSEAIPGASKVDQEAGKVGLEEAETSLANAEVANAPQSPEKAQETANSGDNLQEIEQQERTEAAIELQPPEKPLQPE